MDKSASITLSSQIHQLSLLDSFSLKYFILCDSSHFVTSLPLDLTEAKSNTGSFGTFTTLDVEIQLLPRLVTSKLGIHVHACNYCS